MTQIFQQHEPRINAGHRTVNVGPLIPNAGFYVNSLTFANSSPTIFGVDKAKENGAILIAASIVAAIRLRGEPIKPSPKLNAVIYDSILLAKTILAQMEKS